MSTLDLITAVAPVLPRPDWCRPNGGNIISILWIPSQGEMALKAAAGRLQDVATERGLTIVEVARVPRGSDEAIYVRGEPQP